MSDTARDQAIAQCASVADMVAALECDFDRLQELRESRSDYVSENPLRELDAVYKWGAENPEDAAELADLEQAAGGCADADEARERILEDALSVDVRTSWHTPGESGEPDEFRIVLCTGGPHVEFVGDLNRYGEPDSVRCIFKDWGESGELFDFDHDAALTYCRQFYFGEQRHALRSIRRQPNGALIIGAYRADDGVFLRQPSDNKLLQARK